MTMKISSLVLGLLSWINAAAVHAQVAVLQPDASRAAATVLDCAKYPVWKGDFCAVPMASSIYLGGNAAITTDEVIDRSRAARMGGLTPRSVTAPISGAVTHPKREIPFRNDGGVNNNLIEEGLCQWQQTTVVRFRRAAEKEDVPVIIFSTVDKDTCGVIRDAPSTKALVGGCNDPKVVAFPGAPSFAHETGHLLGLQHEQTRIDVTNYFDIFWDKMPKGGSKQYRFEIDYPESKKKVYKSGVISSPKYDFASIMHYPPREYFWWKEVALPPNVRGPRELLPATQVLLNEQHITTGKVGKSSCVSFEDAATINRLYGGKN